MNNPIEFEDDILLEVILTWKYGWSNIRKYCYDKECKICLESMEDKYILKLPCDHLFHRNCILKNISYKRYTCPECDNKKEFKMLTKN